MNIFGTRISLVVRILIGITIMVPSVSHAAVMMSEIAWMGTNESSYCEWVELHNDASTSVPLSGWQLFEGGGATTVFTLSKTIPANGYLLVERVTPSCPDPIPSVNDEAGSFGGSGLSNSGEDLVLKDTDGTTVQTLNFSSGWPAGDATTKETMQLSGSSWVTANPTPDAPTSGSSTTETSSTPLPEQSTSSTPTYTPSLVLTTPSQVYASVQNTYSAINYLDHYKNQAGYFVWNMGDGAIVRNIGLNPVTHSYKYPGTYTITLNYFPYTALLTQAPELSTSKTITVLSSDISISSFDGGWMKIQNKLATPVDISGWVIQTPTQHAAFPEFSTIAPNATISVDREILGITDKTDPVSLYTPEGKLIATTALPVAVSSSVSNGYSSSNKVLGTKEPVLHDVQVVANDTQNGTVEKPIETTAPQKKNSTKMIIFGAVLLVIIGLFILLERIMAPQE